VLDRLSQCLTRVVAPFEHEDLEVVDLWNLEESALRKSMRDEVGVELEIIERIRIGAALGAGAWPGSGPIPPTIHG